MNRIDDWPFIAFGARGCFGHAFLSEAPGDGVRATWTVVPALPGVEVRPATHGSREPHPRRPDASDKRCAAAAARASCDLYLSMLRRRLPRWASRWQARLDQAWLHDDPLRKAHFAFYGGPYCEGRLDVGIHDAVRDMGDDAFLRASCSFGHLVWDFDRDDNALWVARRCGVFIGRSLMAAGEDGWTVVEHVMSQPTA